MKDSEWLAKTWQQLQKDFALSGLKLDKDNVSSVDEVEETLLLAVAQVKRDNRLFEQLLYRIDLPKKLHAEMLEIESLTEVLILRAFQKVWLRKYYSK